MGRGSAYSEVQAKRTGCCADWPKPCPYHEGMDDGYEMGIAEGIRRAKAVVEKGQK